MMVATESSDESPEQATIATAQESSCGDNRKARAVGNYLGPRTAVISE